MTPGGSFHYETAFSRNLGWVTAEEQSKLRGSRIAIAGLGGAGGFHLLTLARLGIGAFTLAEFDSFEVANFNRQPGATVSSLGRSKLEVMVEQARDINPELDIRVLDAGVTASNVDAFLADADVFVDGFDFFAFDARRVTFAGCATHGIPAVTAAPLGMGAALLSFLPGKMTFEEYFGFEDAPQQELALRFLIGLSPFMLQRAYLVDPSRVSLREQRGPSTVMACELCAGMVATEALKILLRRGKVFAAPWVAHFDAYRNRLARSWRPWGWRNPLQRLALTVGRRHLARIEQGSYGARPSQS